MFWCPETDFGEGGVCLSCVGGGKDRRLTEQFLRIFTPKQGVPHGGRTVLSNIMVEEAACFRVVTLHTVGRMGAAKVHLEWFELEPKEHLEFVLRDMV